MMAVCVQRIRAGLTLIELLCVIAIILVLAGLVLGPASRALHRVRADKWAEDSAIRLQATVEQLQKHFQGKHDFPPVMLENIETEHLVGPAELGFLKDRRVTFIPFAGSDPDEKVVIRVELERGYLTEGGFQTETKGAITAVPE
jgi:prepilin-type N-terminal cleavage/methylation domain-containing protein